MSQNNLMNIRRGFTLIELLVVISIIGMLASIVLAAVSTARTRATVGAGTEFSATNYHALGYDAFAIYNFNETSGSGSSPAALTDTSGNGYNLSCPASSAMVLSTDNPVGAGGNLSGNFSSGGKCTLSLPSSITSFSSFTLSAWIKLTSMPSGEKPIMFMFASNKFLQLDNSSQTVSCATNSFSGMSAASVTKLQTGRWYQITCTDDSSGNLAIYVNGNKEGTYAGASALSWTGGNTMYVWNNTSNAANTSVGYLDDLVIYVHSLSGAEIQKNYAENLPLHMLAEAK